MTSSREGAPPAFPGYPKSSTAARDRFVQLMAEAQQLLDGGLGVEGLSQLVPPALVDRIHHEVAMQWFGSHYILGWAICQQPTAQQGVGDTEAKAKLLRLWADNILRICRELRHPARDDTDQYTSDRVNELTVFWQRLKGAVVWTSFHGDISNLMNPLCRNREVVDNIALALETGWRLLRALQHVPVNNWNGSPLDKFDTFDLMTLFSTRATQVRDEIAGRRHHP
ncbi:MAG TPA: hypothetical protein VK694_00235 [Verrucomicrobiae bacterium]|nr:hypothetical protein [Verrucomicrobiae bacterium]